MGHDGETFHGWLLQGAKYHEAIMMANKSYGLKL